MSDRFNRATLAVGLALYGWSMLGIEFYLRAARIPEGPDRALAQFRGHIMGRAVVGVGAAAVLAALILALLGRSQRRPAAWALALAAGWLVSLGWVWPV